MVISNNYLKSGPLRGELLVVEHGLEDLLVAAGHDADGAEQLEGGDLAAQVLRVEALRDHVNAGGVRQDVGTASLSGKERETNLGGGIHSVR